jgi:transposase
MRTVIDMGWKFGHRPAARLVASSTANWIPDSGLFGIEGGGVRVIGWRRCKRGAMSLRPPLPGHLRTDPVAINELLVGLPDVVVLGAEALDDGQGIELHVMRSPESTACATCGVVARFKGWRDVVLTDVSMATRRVVLHWHKRRWRCMDVDCPAGGWTERDDRIAAPRMRLTRRAALRATLDVGRRGRSVREMADELGCDWHTVNDAVVAYGEALLDADTERIGEVGALGLDEVLMVRTGAFHRQHFTTQLVDVRRGQLLDVVPGRSSVEPMAWLAERGREFRGGIEFGTIDLSGPYRRVFEVMVPTVTLVADPFHVCELANTKLDECRRRVQNETRPPRPAVRPPLPLPAPVDPGEGTPRRQGAPEAPRAVAGRRSEG